MKIISSFVFDVILASFQLYVDVHLVYSFIVESQYGYALATFGILLVPGMLEFLQMSWSMANGDFAGPGGRGWGQYLYWIIFSLFYPLSCIIWHIFNILKGERHFKKFEITARSQVLNSISSMTKAPLQMILQTTVLMLDWFHHDGFYHLTQPLCIVVSLLFLAKHETDHFFFEISGKDVNAKFPYRKATQKFLHNIFHITVRVLCYSLLAAYLKKYSAVFFGAMVLSLFILATCVLKTYVKKNIITSFSGIILPSGAFMSRETFSSRGVAEKRFLKFGKGNALIFAVFVVFGLLASFFLIIYKSDHITCDNIPPLSYNHAKNCPLHSPIKELSMTYLAPHQDDWDHRWFILSFFLVGVLIVVHVILVWIE